MLTGKDFVAGLNDQLVMLIVKPLAGMVCCGSGFLQDRIGSDHLPRNQIFADAEMLERALGLSAPQFVRRHFNFAETIGLLAKLVIQIIDRPHGFLLRQFARARAMLASAETANAARLLNPI